MRAFARALVLLFFARVAASYEVTEEDICCLPKVVGPCEAAIPRWYFNVKSGACEPFTYGGCGGNENNFPNKCACLKHCGNDKDVCCQPKVVGPCKAAMSRWYFNATSGVCEHFIFGGCKGNENNFMTRCDCQNHCGDKKDICCQPKVVGPCKAALHRWYYNAKSGRCERFIFGGCEGNENNFKTRCDCQEHCGDKKDVCCQPKVVGPCRAAMSRWYFNAKSGACERFIFGGCEGNENNFKTRCDCENHCGDKQDICCEPMKSGPCLASFPRWYYNSTHDECKPFTYGGCQGNNNKFEEKCQCEKQCLYK